MRAQIDYHYAERVVSVCSTHSTTVVMDNNISSALAALLLQLTELENVEVHGYLVARNQLEDLRILRKEMFGY